MSNDCPQTQGRNDLYTTSDTEAGMYRIYLSTHPQIMRLYAKLG